MGLIQFENDFKLNTETMKFLCTNGFYMFHGFQWNIICYFWTQESKDMNIQRFGLNLVSNSNSNLF
jgi:hypothetical protein